MEAGIWQVADGRSSERDGRRHDIRKREGEVGLLLQAKRAVSILDVTHDLKHTRGMAT